MHDFYAVLIVIFVPVLGILAGHWFPWRKFLGKDLPRTIAYMYGVSWIMLVPVVTLVTHGYAWISAMLLGSAFAAGCATWGAWLIDHMAETRHALMDERDKSEYASIRRQYETDSED